MVSHKLYNIYEFIQSFNFYMFSVKEECYHKDFLPEWVQNDVNYDIGEEELSKTPCFINQVGDAKIDPQTTLINKQKKLSGNKKKLVNNSRKIISGN